MNFPTKKWPFAVFTALFLGICALPVVLLPMLGGGASAENRTLSSLPSVWTETGPNFDFGSEFETWLSEHFAGRERLVTLNAQLTQATMNTSAEEQVILGSDGWLFYTPTLADYLGTSPLSSRELKQLSTTVSLMQEYVLARGGSFAFTVAPNKNDIYGQYMPYYTKPAATQDEMSEVSAAMLAAGVTYVDLDAVLRAQAAQSSELLYHKRDTHWNNCGSLLCYQLLMDAVSQPHSTYADAIGTSHTDWRGDLDKLLLPSLPVLDEQITYDIDFDALYSYQGPSNVELSRVVTSAAKENPAKGSLLMFRDSFGNALIPFVASAFSDATFLKATPFAPDAMQNNQTVIVEIVQRNLRTVLQAAPEMPAPERAWAQPMQTIMPTQECLMQINPGKEYLQVCGALPADWVPEDARIDVCVQTEQDIKEYEAFPILEQDILEDEAAAKNVCGFSLRVPISEYAQQQPWQGVTVIICSDTQRVCVQAQ